MKSARELSETLFRSGDSLATRSTTCKRLAGGIRSQTADSLGLTVNEELALKKACAILDDAASRLDQASRIKKRSEAALVKRREEVLAALQATFGTLSATRDKVAFIASVDRHILTVGVGSDMKRRFDVEYLLKDIFRDCMVDLAHSIARNDAEIQTLPAAAAADRAWARFQEVRAALQDQYAHVIVKCDRILQDEAPAKQQGAMA